jgi:formate dehydrogenase subunit gamma
MKTQGDKQMATASVSLLARGQHIVWAFLLLGILAAAVPSSAQPSAAPPQQLQQVPTINPDASVMDEQMLFRQAPRIEGRIDILNPEAAVLEQPVGHLWRYFHEVLLHWSGAVVILGMIALLAIAYWFMGRLRISAGRSGIKVHRFNGFERFSHWLTATSFIVLALTGLNITFGKFLLLPVVGPEAFTMIAENAKYVHNFTSFPFVLGLVLIVSLWIKDNIPRKVDIDWLRQGGGFIRSKHPTAGRFNAGEKLVFWAVLGAGFAVAVSGYFLLFPFYVTDIFGMQIAQVAHSVVGVLFVAVIIAHIYIGTIGMEGAFEAMGTGVVDLNWAREHHGLWLEEEIAKGRVPALVQHAAATPGE